MRNKFELAARRALHWARARVPLKSTNKHPSSDHPSTTRPLPPTLPHRAKWERWQDALAWLDRFQGAHPDIGGKYYKSAEEVCSDAELLLHFGLTWRSWGASLFGYTPARAGNCVHLSILAFMYVYKKVGIREVDLVGLGGGGDHVFAVVGQTTRPVLGTDTYPYSGQERSVMLYPKSFDDWDESAWICDPWANIACSARKYREAWSEKMIDWSAKGRHVVYQNVINPCDPAGPFGIDVVARYKKISLMPTGARHKGGAQLTLAVHLDEEK